MNFEAIVSILVAGFAGIIGAIGGLIKIIYKSKVETIKAQNEGNKELLNKLQETTEQVEHNKKKVEKLNQAFGLYVANNGVSQEVKDQVYKILNEE